jgi:hypothetical protein
MIIRETEENRMDLIYLAQDRRDIMKTVKNLRVP